MTFKDFASIPALALLLPLALAGCSDDGPGTEAGTTETGAPGDGDPGDGDPGDGDPGDGDPGDGDPGDGDPGDGDPGDGDPGDCEPAGDAYASFGLDVSDGGMEVDYLVLCTSEGVVASGETGYAITLSGCVSQTANPAPSDMVLSVDSQPATMPFVGVQDSVLLRWVEHPPFIPGKWFTLHDASGQTLLLAGVDGPALVPGNTQDFSYAPLSVAEVGIGCSPFAHDSQCGMAEREALEVGWDGLTATISDRNSGFVGELVSYEVVVGSALDFVQLDCDDFPNKILSALFFLIPEG